MSEQQVDKIYQHISNFFRNSKEYTRRLPEDLTENFDLIESEILDSVGILHLIIFLEEKFEFRVEPVELNENNFKSLHTIAQYIQKKTKGL